ncbi:MAG: dihydropteroate synthase [Candidatus Velamenicoccus archaeovorus]
MVPRVLALKNSADLLKEFKRIGVDGGGMGIMRPKAFLRIVKVSHLPGFCANILKQEMLSLGGDAALSRGSITGTDRHTDCLLLGTFSQYASLSSKLKKQPFGLSELGQEVRLCLARSADRRVPLHLGRRHLRLGRRTLVMGILNATTDSFSGDGMLGASPQRALSLARSMAEEGADIIDIGGESSRPGSRPVSAKEELKRVLPFVKLFAKSLRVALSIDTTKSEVAHAALDCGVGIVNDISALRGDKKMARLVARYGAAVVLMHMKGTPRTMQESPHYDDLMGEITGFLDDSIKKALDSGIRQDKIIIDPGIGFGKTLSHNIEIIERLSELRMFGRPILVGVSRKWFIGRILNAGVSGRLWGTAAAVCAAISGGADIVRVHDVRQIKQVVRVADAIHKRCS